jgi:hypothetical protein
VTTPEERKAVLDAIQAIAETIRTAGQVPAGHVYAAVMGIMTLNTFNSIIDTLRRSGLVKRETTHMLTWIGPTF